MRKNLLPALPDLGRRLTAFRAGAPAATGPALRIPKLTTIRQRGHGLALTEVFDHLTYTASTVTAWFVCEEQVWPFQPDPKREAFIDNCARQYAAVAGLQVHLRRTSIPFDVAAWAAALNGNAQPLPDTVAGGAELSWQAHLDHATRRLADGDYAVSRTYLGVVFNVRVKPGTALPESIDQKIGEIAEDLAAAGMQARPARAQELAWLIYRSVGIGLTPPDHFPGDVGPDDIAEFAEFTDWDRGPYDSTTKITDRRTGRSVHVAVLTFGRMEPLSIPERHQPWLHLSDQADYPVEVSSRFSVLPAEAASGSIQHRLRVLRAQQREYDAHGLDQPLELERLATRAAAVSDEIDTGLPAASIRIHGWHRLAVYGDTEKECLARVRDLTRLHNQQLHASLAHPRGQLALLREFIPGEPTAKTGHMRRMSARMFAAGVPMATAKVGDNRGDLIGYTATSGERPVFFDPHFPMEVRERSGLTVFVSEPGGGKSTLMGALGYLNARRGVRVTLMDPSGPLARICSMPELAPYSRVINLTGSQRGTLAPYAMIPTPRRTDFPDGPDGDIEFGNAVITAEAERELLVLDICHMLLPAQVVVEKETTTALRAALRMVPPKASSTIDDVITMLYDQNDIGSPAHIIADLLRDMERLPMGKLFFGRPPAGTLSADSALTVISMAGIRLPNFQTDRRYWSLEETLAVPALHLANLLAVRRSYSGDMQARKLVGLDEIHIMSGWDSGRAFLDRLARDSRKWNIAAIAASQNPRDILLLAMQNLVTSVFVGRIAEDQEIASEALRLLGIVTGHGYEATLAGLSQYSKTNTDRLGYREFVMRDVDDRVQKVRIDISHIPGLLAALNTTPGSR